MDKANFRRLSAMECTQAETNKRLEDVMQSNLNLHSMLKFVLSSLSNPNVIGNLTTPHADVDENGEKSRCLPDIGGMNVGNSSGKASSKKWWDMICKSLEEEDYDEENGVRSPTLNNEHMNQVDILSLQ